MFTIGTEFIGDGTSERWVDESKRTRRSGVVERERMAAVVILSKRVVRSDSCFVTADSSILVIDIVNSATRATSKMRSTVSGRASVTFAEIYGASTLTIANRSMLSSALIIIASFRM